jgi:hypothetical protein
MIALVSGFGMGVGRFSRPLGGVGVLAMPDVGLHTMGCVKSVCEDSLGAGVLQQLVTGIGVGAIIDCHCVADGLNVTHLVLSATQELFSQDEGVEF